MSEFHNVHDWVQRQRELLELEKGEEMAMLQSKLSSLSAKECEEEGLSILSLNVVDISTALYGRSCYTIERIVHSSKSKTENKNFPAHSFKVGDEAILYSPKHRSTPQADSSNVTGIISKVTKTSIELIVSEGKDDDVVLEPPLRLDMLANEATHNKISGALTELIEGDSPAAPLVNILFHDAPVLPPDTMHITPFNPDLNSSQVGAVEYALGSRHLSLIHGPPGTGKTTTITELILQAVELRWKVLVVSASNVAVDNVLEKLLKPSLQSTFMSRRPRGSLPLAVMRVGHPARLTDSVKEHCLDALLLRADGTEIVNDIRSDISRMIREAAAPKTSYAKRRELRTELRTLRKEARKREEKVLRQILQNRDVVLATCVGASSKLLNKHEFDLVIIDEAAQALEAACWIAMQKSKRVCLAGDHCQLPPTVKCKAAEDGGLSRTLFERISSSSREDLASTVKLLDTQYRMNKDIGNWASREMYHSKLQHAESVANHSLLDLPNVDMTKSGDDQEACESVLLLIDTAGCDMYEEMSVKGSSRNPSEALIVKTHVCRLLDSGLRADQIGVITPYNGQLEVIRALFDEESDGDSRFSGLELRTVDGFQGGEKEAIVISLVRSNPSHTVGFLADKRRINVAVTRAKRHLAVICDSETVQTDAFIGRLLEHLNEFGEIRSGAEFDCGDAFYLTQGASGAGIKSGVNPDRPKKASSGKSSSSIGSSSFGGSSISKLGPLEAENDDDDIEIKMFAKQLDDVRQGIVPTVEFSSGLSSFQRMRIHALSEERNLIHISIGEGDSRRIVVSLVPDKDKTIFKAIPSSPLIKSSSTVDIQTHDLNDADKMEKIKENNDVDKYVNDDDDNDGEEDDDDDDVDGGSSEVKTDQSQQGKKKKKKKKKTSKGRRLDEDLDTSKSTQSGSGGGKSATKCIDEDFDDDELLMRAMAENAAIAKYNQYRLPSQAMPNPEKVKSKSVIQSRLAEAQDKRRSSGAGKGEVKPKKTTVKPTLPAFRGRGRRLDEDET